MRLNVAWVSLCAVVLVSACTRDPGAAEDTHAVATETQTVVENAPVAQDTVAGPCEDAPDQRAMTACWSSASRTEEERVDAALKKADALLVSKSGPTAGQQLQDDQRRWQEFVEGHCGLYGALYDGGSARPMTVAVCRWQLAQDRLQHLARLTQEFDR
jgi:uncharacterized protein YecT (DUF1311 family)